MKRTIKQLTLLLILLIFSITLMFTFSFTALALGNGVLEVKDTDLNQAMMLSHVTPHSKEGAVIEFDVTVDPSNVAGTTGAYGNELILFAGLPRNELIPGVCSFGGSLFEGSAVAVNINNNKLSYYPKGYSFYTGNAGFSFNGTGTFENDWRTTLNSAPYVSGKTIRATYNFSTSTFKLESKDTGDDDSTYVLIALLTGINNNGGLGFEGYAGMFFDNISAKIDNFKVTDINGTPVANQAFEGEFIFPNSTLKAVYGGDTVISLYDRTTNVATTVDVGGPPAQIYSYHISAGNTGVDSVGAVLTLAQTSIVFDYATGTFNPYQYITSVVDSTDEINATTVFAELAGLTVKYFKDGSEEVAIDSEAIYSVSYCFTDGAGNNAFAVLTVDSYSSLESFEVTGVVRFNSAPIADALISYGEGLSITTDANGQYTISIFAGNNLSLNVTAEGYQPLTVTVNNVTTALIKNIDMVLSDLLYVKGTDETTAIISHIKPHSANGVSYEFDVLQDPNITGNYFSSVILFAGLEYQTITGYGAYLQLLNESAVYIDINRQQIVYYPKAMGTNLPNLQIDNVSSANGINTVNPTKIIAGYTYKATYDFINSTFKLERKTLEGGSYETKLTMSGIYNAGSGYAGIGLERAGIIIDNFKVTDLNGAALADQTFSSNIPVTNDGKVFYGGDTVLSVFEAATANHTTTNQINLSSVMMTGLKGDDRDHNGPEIVLSNTNLKHNKVNIFNPYEYIISVSDVKDNILIEDGFSSLQDLSVSYYKDGLNVLVLDSIGNYVINYSYSDSFGNTVYDYFVLEVFENDYLPYNLTVTHLNNQLYVKINDFVNVYEYQYWIKTKVVVDGIANLGNERYIWQMAQSYNSNDTGIINIGTNGDFLINGSYEIIVRIKESEGGFVKEIHGSFTPESVGQIKISTVSVNGRSDEELFVVDKSDGVMNVEINSNVLENTTFSLLKGDTVIESNNITGVFAVDISKYENGLYKIKINAFNGTETDEKTIKVYIFGQYEANEIAVIQSLTGTSPSGNTTFVMQLKYANGDNISLEDAENYNISLISEISFVEFSTFQLNSAVLEAVFTTTYSKHGIYRVVGKVSRVGISGEDDTIIVYYKGYSRAAELTQTGPENNTAVVNTEVAITSSGSVTESVGVVKYAYYREDASGWVMIRDYDESGVLKWRPTKAGFYNISVRIKAADGGNYEKDVVKTYTITSGGLEGILTLKAFDYTSGEEALLYEAGKPYKLTARYTGGTENVLYMFTVYNVNQGLTYLNMFSTSESIMFVPNKRDTYIITVRVINAQNFGYMDKSQSITISTNNIT